ncbi:MAG: division/cell wall cluster transcriptional repressor MraZ [Pseudomonadota bacterium]
MSAFGGYSGQAYSPAGDKGRFVLPPAFRKAVKESSGGSKILCLAKHERWNCLTGFGLSRKEELEDQLDREEERALRLNRDDFDRDLRAMQLFGFAEVPFDDSGRFIMPDHLRTLGKVEDGLYFHGGGRFFTIWNPVQLSEMGEQWESAQVACANLVADAAAKGKRK